MKCVSLWQPRASLVEHGHKRIETRGWSTDYRGPLAIHAAKTWNRELEEVCGTPFFFEALSEIAGGPIGVRDRMPRRVIPFGAIVATCRLVGVVPVEHLLACEGTYQIHDDLAHESRRRFDTEGVRPHHADFALKTIDFQITHKELAFGDYSTGRFAWLLADVKPLPTPIPFKGAQGLFNVPDEVFSSEVL